MLARYQMKRGAPAAELPDGVRMDTRKHTRHVLRPPAKLVTQFLGSAIAWAAFRTALGELPDPGGRGSAQGCVKRIVATDQRDDDDPECRHPAVGE